MNIKRVKMKILLFSLILAFSIFVVHSYADDGLTQGTTLKEFDGIEGWINSSPLTLANLKNKVVIIDFYTSRCSNCLAAVPHVVFLYQKYHSKGLEVIGVHTPELASEHQIEVIKATAKKLGINYPIAIDNDSRTWNAYNNHYWPNLLIFDRQGKLVFQHAGEGAYDEIDRKVSALL
jgi:thiol-disulfide isomerase/thioredoxin